MAQEARRDGPGGIAVAGVVRTPDVLLEAARSMRREMTRAEAVVWARVRRGQIGYHLRRQQALAGYVADFYCHAARLAIEIDGPVHLDQADRDANRDARLAEIGVTVIRFTNEQVFIDSGSVVSAIRDAIMQRVSARK